MQEDKVQERGESQKKGSTNNKATHNPFWQSNPDDSTANEAEAISEKPHQREQALSTDHKLLEETVSPKSPPQGPGVKSIRASIQHLHQQLKQSSGDATGGGPVNASLFKAFNQLIRDVGNFRVSIPYFSEELYDLITVVCQSDRMPQAVEFYERLGELVTLISASGVHVEALMNYLCDHFQKDFDRKNYVPCRHIFLKNLGVVDSLQNTALQARLFYQVGIVQLEAKHFLPACFLLTRAYQLSDPTVYLKPKAALSVFLVVWFYHLIIAESSDNSPSFFNGLFRQYQSVLDLKKLLLLLEETGDQLWLINHFDKAQQCYEKIGKTIHVLQKTSQGRLSSEVLQDFETYPQKILWVQQQISYHQAGLSEETIAALIETPRFVTDQRKLNKLRKLKEQVPYNKALRKFMIELIERSKDILGPPPCRYSLLMMGSPSREEACFYSDLEFMVLVERQDPWVSCYFRALVECVHLHIIMLGESPDIQHIPAFQEVVLGLRFDTALFPFSGKEHETLLFGTVTDVVSKLIPKVSQYSYNLMFKKGVPQLQRAKPGYYLYRHNGQVYVQVEHKITCKTVNLSVHAPSEMLQSIEWPKEKKPGGDEPEGEQEKEYKSTTLSETLIDLLHTLSKKSSFQGPGQYDSPIAKLSQIQAQWLAGDQALFKDFQTQLKRQLLMVKNEVGYHAHHLLVAYMATNIANVVVLRKDGDPDRLYLEKSISSKLLLQYSSYWVQCINLFYLDKTMTLGGNTFNQAQQLMHKGVISPLLALSFQFLNRWAWQLRQAVQEHAGTEKGEGGGIDSFYIQDLGTTYLSAFSKEDFVIVVNFMLKPIYHLITTWLDQPPAALTDTSAFVTLSSPLEKRLRFALHYFQEHPCMTDTLDVDIRHYPLQALPKEISWAEWNTFFSKHTSSETGELSNVSWMLRQFVFELGHYFGVVESNPIKLLDQLCATGVLESAFARCYQHCLQFMFDAGTVEEKRQRYWFHLIIKPLQQYHRSETEFPQCIDPYALYTLDSDWGSKQSVFGDIVNEIVTTLRTFWRSNRSTRLTEPDQRSLQQLFLHVPQSSLCLIEPLIQQWQRQNEHDEIYESFYRWMTEQCPLSAETEALRQVYIESLQHHASEKPALIERLLEMPRADGVRQSERVAYDTLNARIKAVTTSTPQAHPEGITVTLTLPDGSQRYLAPDAIDTLIERQTGDLKRNRQGKHHVFAYQNLVFKQKPDHPGMSSAIDLLTRRIVGHGTPANRLVCCHFDDPKHGIDKTYSLLVSSEVPGETLQAWEKSHPGQKLKISTDTFTELLFMTVLTLPGDGALRNLVLAPLSDGNVYPHSVDNAQMCVEPMVKGGFLGRQKLLQLRSAILCLPQMRTLALSERVLRRIVQLNTLAIVDHWLQDVAVMDRQYAALFSKTLQEQFYKENQNNPSVCGVLFPEGEIIRLVLTIDTLLKPVFEHALHRNQPLYATEVLRYVHLPLAERYQSVLNQTRLSLSGRYQEISNYAQVSVTSGDALKASLRRIPTFETVNSRQRFSPQQAQQELRALVFKSLDQDTVITRVSKAGLATVRIDFSIVVRPDGQPDTHRQRLILAYLLELLPSLKLQSLALPHCVCLDDTALAVLLSKADTLITLNLRSCPKLTQRSVELIAKCCPRLETLYLSNNPGIQKFCYSPILGFGNVISFPTLRTLHVSNCNYLTKILLSAPSLIDFKISNLSRLKEMHLDCPQLTTLDLHGNSHWLTVKDPFYKDRAELPAELKQFNFEKQFLFPSIFSELPKLQAVKLTNCHVGLLAICKLFVFSFQFSHFDVDLSNYTQDVYSDLEDACSEKFFGIIEYLHKNEEKINKGSQVLVTLFDRLGRLGEFVFEAIRVLLHRAIDVLKIEYSYVKNIHLYLETALERLSQEIRNDNDEVNSLAIYSESIAYHLKKLGKNAHKIVAPILHLSRRSSFYDDQKNKKLYLEFGSSGSTMFCEYPKRTLVFPEGYLEYLMFEIRNITKGILFSEVRTFKYLSQFALEMIARLIECLKSQNLLGYSFNFQKDYVYYSYAAIILADLNRIYNVKKFSEALLLFVMNTRNYSANYIRAYSLTNAVDSLLIFNDNSIEINNLNEFIAQVMQHKFSSKKLIDFLIRVLKKHYHSYYSYSYPIGETDIVTIRGVKALGKLGKPWKSEVSFVLINNLRRTYRVGYTGEVINALVELNDLESFKMLLVDSKFINERSKIEEALMKNHLALTELLNHAELKKWLSGKELSEAQVNFIISVLKIVNRIDQLQEGLIQTVGDFLVGLPVYTAVVSPEGLDKICKIITEILRKSSLPKNIVLALIGLSKLIGEPSRWSEDEDSLLVYRLCRKSVCAIEILFSIEPVEKQWIEEVNRRSRKLSNKPIVYRSKAPHCNEIKIDNARKLTIKSVEERLEFVDKLKRNNSELNDILTEMEIELSIYIAVKSLETRRTRASNAIFTWREEKARALEKKTAVKIGSLTKIVNRHKIFHNSPLQFPSQARNWLDNGAYHRAGGGAPLIRLNETTLKLTLLVPDSASIKEKLLTKFSEYIREAVGSEHVISSRIEAGYLTLTLTTETLTNALVEFLTREGFRLDSSVTSEENQLVTHHCG